MKLKLNCYREMLNTYTGYITIGLEKATNFRKHLPPQDLRRRPCPSVCVFGCLLKHKLLSQHFSYVDEIWQSCLMLLHSVNN